MIYNDIKFLSQELNFKLKKLADDINELFKDSNNIIKNILLKKKIKTRQNKISFIDALCYIFNYSFIDNSKQSVVSSYNFENNKNANRSNYYKKELKIPISFYNDIFIKIKKLLDKYLNKNINPFNVISVDGTYNNTNLLNNKKLETSLNMGYYDATNKIPIDLEFKGIECKNKEISSFIDYIKKNNFDIDNLILVFDRAYFSYEFIDLLIKNKLNFVIRAKNNSICIKDEKQISNKFTDKNIRFIKYSNKNITIQKDKNNNDVKIEETIICNIVTNLNIDKYDDKLIKEIYLMRWDVEVFFKLLKSNFKFADLKEHNKNTIEQYKKKYLIILINIYLVRIIELTFEKYNKKKHKFNSNKKNKNIYNIKNNNTLMIEGLKKIINPIIKSDVNQILLKNYCDCYIKKTNTIKEKSNPRVSKIPHTKWYVKSYSNYYQYVRIIDALKENNLDKLNKNLKLLANNTKIIK
jgi:hypothetical protein